MLTYHVVLGQHLKVLMSGSFRSGVRKIRRFRELLPPEEFVLDTPDLNVPSFERLDFEAMVDLGVARGRAAPPDVIVGSSLGSLVALAVARAGMMWDGFSTRPPPAGPEVRAPQGDECTRSVLHGPGARLP